MFASLAATCPAQAQADRSREGDWSIVDHTDNNTGEREVYAMNILIDKSDFVTVRMKCREGKPVFTVDWWKESFPDQTVLTIGPVLSADAEAREEHYVFENSTDTVERGLIASPETSARIVTAMGNAQTATLAAHLSSGRRTVELEVSGTQSAWSRVARHCPVQKVPVPPM